MPHFLSQMPALLQTRSAEKSGSMPKHDARCPGTIKSRALNQIETFISCMRLVVGAQMDPSFFDAFADVELANISHQHLHL